MFVLITPVVHNNGFRGIIIGIIALTVGLYIATDLSPLITNAAANVQFDMGGATAISSICDGANPLTWVITRSAGYLGVFGLLLIAVLAFSMVIWNHKRIVKEAVELHEAEAESSNTSTASCSDEK
jgi:PTS system galactitol-specific IIC component